MKLAQVKRLAICAAKRDGYNQTIIQCGDGTYSFCREWYGNPTVWLETEDKIVGHIIYKAGTGRYMYVKTR